MKIRTDRKIAWLSFQGALTTTLTTIILEHFGTEALEYHPETIIKDLEDEFDIEIPEINKTKINAGITLLTTDLFNNSLSGHLTLTLALNNIPVDPDVFVPSNVAEEAWGIIEAAAIDDESYNPDSYSPEIQEYIRLLLNYEGFVHVPKPLDAVIKSYTPPNLSVLQDPEMISILLKLKSDETDAIERMVLIKLEILKEQLKDLTGKEPDFAFLERMELLPRIARQSA